MDSNNFAEYSNEVMPVANGTSAGYSAYDSAVAAEQVKQAKENGSDMIIVYFHYGNEYSRSPNDDQVAMSHEVIDAGADVVLGSHPHVTQGIEVYNGKPIFYSLGNFIFDQSNPATHRAYFVEIDMINDTGVCTVYPVDIVNYIPQFMSAEDGKGLLAELNPQCEQLSVTDEGVGKLQSNMGQFPSISNGNGRGSSRTWKYMEIQLCSLLKWWRIIFHPIYLCNFNNGYSFFNIGVWSGIQFQGFLCQYSKKD